jgi:hypothetical protein
VGGVVAVLSAVSAVLASVCHILASVLVATLMTCILAILRTVSLVLGQVPAVFQEVCSAAGVGIAALLCARPGGAGLSTWAEQGAGVASCGANAGSLVGSLALASEITVALGSHLRALVYPLRAFLLDGVRSGCSIGLSKGE